MEDKPFSQQKMSFNSEELERIGQAVKEIDEAVGNALIDINRREKSETGQWNLIMAFYIIIKSRQQKIEPTITAKGVYKQVKSLNQIDIPTKDDYDL